MIDKYFKGDKKRGYSKSEQESFRDERDYELYDFHVNNPDTTLRKIGETFGIAPQTVSRIITRERELRNSLK